MLSSFFFLQPKYLRKSSHRTEKAPNLCISGQRGKNSSHGKEAYPEMIFPKPVKSFLLFRLCHQAYQPPGVSINQWFDLKTMQVISFPAQHSVLQITFSNQYPFVKKMYQMYPFLKWCASFLSVFALINTSLHYVYSAKPKSEILQHLSQRKAHVLNR